MTIVTYGFGTPNKQLTYGLGKTNVVLHYLSQQAIDPSCLSTDYETSRNCIFGEGAEIFDKPLTKLVMFVCGYLKAKYRVTQSEYLIDKVKGIYRGVIGRFWFIEILSALMARITNLFQAFYGYRNEDIEQIKRDIEYLIHEFIYRNMKYDTVAYIDITIMPQQNKYSVGLSICE